MYCEDVDIAELAVAVAEQGRRGGVSPHAVDPGHARRLWAVSAELTGLDAFAAGA